MTINTKAIQKAIDECSAEGGGIVLIQGGNYVTGTIFMKSGVTLRIEKMAVLSGSKDIKDYAENVMKTCIVMNLIWIVVLFLLTIRNLLV